MDSIAAVRAGRAALLLATLFAGAESLAQPPAPATPMPPPSQADALTAENVTPAADGGSLLGTNTQPIDLDSALRLAGVQNPELMIARERVTESVALRQLAAAQILPNINAGGSYDNHTGNLQQSTGAILAVNRSALYAGAGAATVGAGTVNIPGVVWNVQVSDAIYNYLIARQAVVAHTFAAEASRNNVLLRVAEAYEELLRAEGIRAIALKTAGEAKEVARLTAAYAQTGQGRKADADRAATELAQRQFELVQAEGDVLTAAARLSQLLSLDPSMRLHPIDAAVVPAPIVYENSSLQELIATAIVARPELEKQRSLIEQALLALNGAKALPFTPTVVVGYSGGVFGGGSNLVTPEFGDFNGRTDFDVVVYWSLRNLGIGNRALVNGAASRSRSADYQMLEVLDQVRDEVAEARARARTRLAQIVNSQQAVKTAEQGFTEDMIRIRGREGLPIEILDSLRLLEQARYDYLNAIVDYNRAQFELYVALGQPPLSVLARFAPAEQIPAPPAQSPRP